MLLMVAPLDLEEQHLDDIILESPANKRRRIDVEIGSCVFEVKRDLQRGKVGSDAENESGKARQLWCHWLTMDDFEFVRDDTSYLRPNPN